MQTFIFPFKTRLFTPAVCYKGHKGHADFGVFGIRYICVWLGVDGNTYPSFKITHNLVSQHKNQIPLQDLYKCRIVLQVSNINILDHNGVSTEDMYHTLTSDLSNKLR